MPAWDRPWQIPGAKPENGKEEAPNLRTVTPNNWTEPHWTFAKEPRKRGGGKHWVYAGMFRSGLSVTHLGFSKSYTSHYKWELRVFLS